MFGARELAQRGAERVWQSMKESVGSVEVRGSDDCGAKAEVTDRPPEGGDNEDKMEI